MLGQSSISPSRRAASNSDINIEQDYVRVTLDKEGLIADCSMALEPLFGYRQEELAGQHISTLFPELAHTDLVVGGAVNPRFAYLCHCGKSFVAVRHNGSVGRCSLAMCKVGDSASEHFILIIRNASV